MINNITFTGRETMLINATERAAETALRKAEAAKAKVPEVIKASSVLPEIRKKELYTYIPYDVPVQTGKNIDQVT